MNVKSLMLLLAFAGLGASCSDDERNGGDTSGIAGRSELQIVFSGTGESQEYTKATASEGENKIDKLQVYLFAAATTTRKPGTKAPLSIQKTKTPPVTRRPTSKSRTPERDGKPPSIRTS